MSKHIKYFFLLSVFVGGILFLSIKRVAVIYLEIASNGLNNNSLFPGLTDGIASVPEIAAVMTAIFGILLHYISEQNSKKHQNRLIYLLLFQPVVFISIILSPFLIILPLLLMVGFCVLPASQRLLATSAISLISGILFPDLALPSFLFFIVSISAAAFEIDFKTILIAGFCMVCGIFISLAVQSKLEPSLHFIKFSHTVFISLIFAIPVLMIMLFKGEKKMAYFLTGLFVLQYLAECFLSKRYTGLAFLFMLQSIVTYPLLLGSASHKFKSRNMQIALISLIIFSLFITLFHFKTILEIDSFSFSMLESMETSSTLKIVTFSVFYVILFFLILFLLLKDSFRAVVNKHFVNILLILLISNFTWKCIMQPLVQERKERLNSRSQSQNHETP